MRLRLFLLSVLLTAACGISYGQVTIGSGIPPIDGALLDLKEKTPTNPATDNITATKGLILPRVNLTNLRPAVSTGTNSLPASIGAPASENWDLAIHIGLTVYNVKKGDQCASEPIHPGAYTWTGTEWQYIDHPGTLAPGVMYHKGKPNPDYINQTTTTNEPTNIYEEFYSAEFDAAGRWMTTNLTAWKYDSNIPASRATLPTRARH